MLTLMKPKQQQKTVIRAENGHKPGPTDTMKVSDRKNIHT